MYPSHHVIYLRAYLDEFVNWVTHVNQHCVKLVKAYAMLSETQYFVSETTCLSISFAIFNSHLYYVCNAWRQSIVSSHRVCILHRTAVHIICKIQWSYNSTILQNENYKSMENYFINKYFSYKSYSVFSHQYILATGRHNHQTQFSMNVLKYYLVAILLNLAQKLSYILQSFFGILSKFCFQKRIPD